MIYREVDINKIRYIIHKTNFKVNDNLRGVKAELLVRVDGHEDGGNPGVDLVPLKPDTQQVSNLKFQF